MEIAQQTTCQSLSSSIPTLKKELVPKFEKRPDSPKPKAQVRTCISPPLSLSLSFSSYYHYRIQKVQQPNLRKRKWVRETFILFPCPSSSTSPWAFWPWLGSDWQTDWAQLELVGEWVYEWFQKCNSWNDLSDEPCPTHAIGCTATNSWRDFGVESCVLLTNPFQDNESVARSFAPHGSKSSSWEPTEEPRWGSPPNRQERQSNRDGLTR